MLKKLTQHVDNHQQYVNAYQACIMWFDATNKRLATSADTTGDKAAIQARLDNLHVGVVYRTTVLTKHVCQEQQVLHTDRIIV